MTLHRKAIQIPPPLRGRQKSLVEKEKREEERRVSRKDRVSGGERGERGMAVGEREREHHGARDREKERVFGDVLGGKEAVALLSCAGDGEGKSVCRQTFILAPLDEVRECVAVCRRKRKWGGKEEREIERLKRLRRLMEERRSEREYSHILAHTHKLAYTRTHTPLAGNTSSKGGCSFFRAERAERRREKSASLDVSICARPILARHAFDAGV